jgi:uncharacterized protein YkwD
VISTLQNISKITGLVAVLTLAACGSSQRDPDLTGFSGLINPERARNDARPIAQNAKLTAAAQAHANDMAATNNFSHTSRSGTTPSDRARAQGYSFCFIAENIAHGHPTEEQAFTAWMTSNGHRENMLTRSATQYGIAVTDDNYWVLLLGRPCN